MVSRALISTVFLSLVLDGCSEALPSNPTITPLPASVVAPVIQNYALGALASYGQVVTSATAMQTAVNAMLDAPSVATLEAARRAWIAARMDYGPTEAFRFYGGPIDSEALGNLEGRINAWPLDENYIDYVIGVPMSGIIQNPATLPAITRTALVELNERGGEENIATGWHAVEFLLWGQDMSPTSAGNRPHTDYVMGTDGTGNAVERRRTYLREVTDQLITDLTAVRDQWNRSQANHYVTTFTTVDPNVSLRGILRGIAALSGPELAGQRMAVALETRDQENEHSCFSDTTHNDIANNALGVQNVWLGRFGSTDGPGIDDLVRARDPMLATQLTEQIAASVAATRAIPPPFDQAILGASDSPQRMRVAAAIAALRVQTTSFSVAAVKLGVQIVLDP
jgi:putative iron-regulated protein